MKTIFWILFLVFISQVAVAFEPWGTYGMETRWVKDSTQNINPKQMNPIALGFGLGNFIFYYETASYSELTGNTSLSVNSTFKNQFIMMDYHNDNWGLSEYFIPFIGVGAGLSQNSVDTTLLGTTTQDSSRNYWLSTVQAGIYWNYTKLIWLSAEGRLLFGEKTEPTPQFSGLCRLGFWIR